MPDNVDQKAPKILFVDDEMSVLKSLVRFGRSRSWDCTTAVSGEQGLLTLDGEDFDIVVSDMRMPCMSGAEFLEQVKQSHPHTVRVLLTGYSDAESTEKAINDAHIFNYVSKPWDEEAFEEVIAKALEYREETIALAKNQESNLVQNKKLSKLALLLSRQVKEKDMEVEQALGLLDMSSQQQQQNARESLAVLNQVLEWKEGRDAGHGRFVEEYALKIAKEMELEDRDIEKLGFASMLHRVGMLALPDSIRERAQYDLDQDEKNLFRQHPVWGEMALSSASSLQEVGKIIRHHQEFVSGQGFPDQLTDKDIPLLSKIICVVGDFYDAFNGRIDKQIEGLEAASAFIDKWTGKKYDAKVVKAFWAVIGDFGKQCIQNRTLETGKLQPEMVLNQDLISAKGMLLLTKGTVLDFSQIQTLKNNEKKLKETFLVSVLVDNCK